MNTGDKDFQYNEWCARNAEFLERYTREYLDKHQKEYEKIIEETVDNLVKSHLDNMSEKDWQNYIGSIVRRYIAVSNSSFKKQIEDIRELFTEQQTINIQPESYLKWHMNDFNLDRF